MTPSFSKSAAAGLMTALTLRVMSFSLLTEGGVEKRLLGEEPGPVGPGVSVAFWAHGVVEEGQILEDKDLTGL